MKHLAALFITLFLFALPVRAADLIAVTEQWPPFNYKNDNGTVTGLSTEILREALKNAGLGAEFRVLPWARAYDTAQTTPGVFIFSILRTPARESLFQWIGPIVPALSVNLYKRKVRNDISIDTLDDAKRYTTAVMKDGSTQLFLQSQGFEFGDNLEVASSNELGIKKLFRDRVDLISGNAPAMATLARSIGHSFSELEMVIPLYNSDLYIATTPRTPRALVDKLQAGINAIPPETIDIIVQSYLH